ncbi:MAG: SPOR domain-containing protein [Candidatus Omnitrophota bacterium]
MEKDSPHQLEMFSAQDPSFPHKGGRRDNLFFNFVRNYEKAVLVIIGMVTVSIISFGLGVEKGRNVSSTKFSPRLDMAKNPPLPTVAPVEQPKPQVEREPVALPESSVEVEAKEKSAPQFLEQQGYVIQLASYKERTLADKEAEALKKKGFSPIILKKGVFTVLYVGSFASKDSATSQLSELRKRYTDCYVRRL